MIEGFKQMEKRFESLQADMNRRFEQVDKRSEQVDKRFESMQADRNKRFEQQHQEILALRQDMNREIIGLHREIKRLMRWSFGTLLALGGLIVVVLRLTF